MRWIFEQLFDDAGFSLDDNLTLVPADTLARHAWRAGGRLDLFADVQRSAAAIGDFAGAGAARGYLAFCARSREIYQTLRSSFMTAERPSPLGLAQRVGFSKLGALLQTAPGRTMWSVLGDYFQDQRLRQLFGRYATYTGCSPFQAPATLMLVAHVEQDGVWLVEGGMQRIADALHRIGASLGARYRFDTHVQGIMIARGRTRGVQLGDGERLDADAVVFNGDSSALGLGLLGPGVGTTLEPVAMRDRSLSAITWCLQARCSGFPLEHHNVFFAEDYAAEFDAIFEQRTICHAPTVYVCRQSAAADDADRPPARQDHRLLVLINAPAGLADAALDLQAVQRRSFGLLASCGLEVDPGAAAVTTPAGFADLFPGSGGALYGQANHGAFSAFRRPGARTRTPGLYLAGGTVHPGPGIPMATMSGRLAAARLLADWRASRQP